MIQIQNLCPHEVAVFVLGNAYPHKILKPQAIYTLPQDLYLIGFDVQNRHYRYATGYRHASLEIKEFELKEVQDNTHLLLNSHDKTGILFFQKTN
jgi:hypothetical protein